MKEIIEKIKENKVKTSVISVFVLLVIILGVLFGFGIIKSENFAFVPGIIKNQSANVIDVTEIENTDGENVSNDEKLEEKDPSVVMIDGQRYFANVRVPILVEGDLFDHQGKKVACNNEIAFSNVSVDLTRAPLNAALNLIFNSDKNFEIDQEKSLQNQDSLKFIEAKIENKVAMIYLSGEFPSEEGCDFSRQITQLEEVALQFDTVDAVQIYLNGELVR